MRSRRRHAQGRSGPLVPPGPPLALDPKSTQFAENLAMPGFMEIDSMKSSVGTDRVDSMPSIVPNDIVSLSDDECVARLARVIDRHDLNHLDEIAQLIGRLAVTIE